MATIMKMGFMSFQTVVNLISCPKCARAFVLIFEQEPGVFVEADEHFDGFCPFCGGQMANEDKS